MELFEALVDIPFCFSVRGLAEARCVRRHADGQRGPVPRPAHLAGGAVAVSGGSM